MKTQKVRPKDVRVGDEIILEIYPRSMVRDGFPTPHKVLSILAMPHGIFTPCPMWKFTLSCESMMGHHLVSFFGRHPTGVLEEDVVTIKQRDKK